MKRDDLVLSTLSKAWFIDIDGTIAKHNGYLVDGYDTPLDESVDFITQLPVEDTVILVTARSEEYRDSTINFLKKNGIRFDHILFGMPTGERIVINDCKPSGLKMSYAINLERDSGICCNIRYDPNL